MAFQLNLGLDLHSYVERFHLNPNVLAVGIDHYIKKHAVNPCLVLEEVCKPFKITTHYAIKLLKKHTGMNYRTRLAYHRVKLSIIWMESSSVNLSEIAKKSGFKTPSRMTEAFKKIEGKTPKKVRDLVSLSGKQIT